MPVPEYELFTSFRYDPKLLTAPFNTEVNGIELPYLLFVYHFDRLVAAATAFGWGRAIQTMKAPGAAERLRHMCDQTVMDCTLPDKEKGLGLRVLLSPAGELRVEAYPAWPLTRDPLCAAYLNPTTMSADALPAPIFTVYLDTKPTPASAYKTTARAHSDAARARCAIRDRRDATDVLLYNECGEATEASARNVAFWRDGWVTPPERCGVLPGTIRRYLLERGLVREEVVHVADVRPGEWVLLSNGWDGTLLGRVVRD